VASILDTRVEFLMGLRQSLVVCTNLAYEALYVLTFVGFAKEKMC